MWNGSQNICKWIW